MNRPIHLKSVFLLGVAASLLVAMTSGVVARTVTIDLMRADVQAHAPSDETLGNYYTFDVPLPERRSRERFMSATLELYVDAASAVDEVARGGVLTLEVFAMKSAQTAEVTMSDLQPGPVTRTVQTGQSKRVRLDISELVGYLLEHPDENHGLVVGSLTGQRVADFTLRHGVIARDVSARVTIMFAELGDGFATRQ